MKPWTCAGCGVTADPTEQARIDGDHPECALRWFCPACAPELLAMPSGLTFGVVEIGGASFNRYMRLSDAAPELLGHVRALLRELDENERPEGGKEDTSDAAKAARATLAKLERP